MEFRLLLTSGSLPTSHPSTHRPTHPQHLELEASLPRWGIHRIFAPIKESCFPELQELIVDDGSVIIIVVLGACHPSIAHTLIITIHMQGT